MKISALFVVLIALGSCKTAAKSDVSFVISSQSNMYLADESSTIPSVYGNDEQKADQKLAKDLGQVALQASSEWARKPDKALLDKFASFSSLNANQGKKSEPYYTISVKSASVKIANAVASELSSDLKDRVFSTKAVDPYADAVKELGAAKLIAQPSITVDVEIEVTDDRGRVVDKGTESAVTSSNIYNFKLVLDEDRTKNSGGYKVYRFTEPAPVQGKINTDSYSSLYLQALKQAVLKITVK